MNKDQRDQLLIKTIAIDRSFGRTNHDEIHRNMMRIINRLTVELFETQEELKELKKRLDM